MNSAETYAVAHDPFPHVLVDDYLDADTYSALAASFPDCGPNSGPTGFTMFWGDKDYDALIASNHAWRALFDHYVFRPDGHPLAHLPADRHGILGPLRPSNYGRIRASVMRLLRGG